MTTTRVWVENNQALVAGKRRALNQGGTSSTKTYSILQILALITQYAKKPTLISVVAESLPHLKKGAIRDFFNIIGESQQNNPRYNRTDHVYRASEFGTVEFFGADDANKARGPRRQFLFLNEANNIPWETARGLDIRTETFTFLDWNPVGEFWAHQYESGGTVYPGWLHDPTSAFIRSTYLDAKKVLPQSVIDNIESNRDKDPNWWNVFGLGLTGKVEGLVYPVFSQVKELPEQGQLIYGLDFGFSGDPAVLTRHKVFPQTMEIYSEELFYELGLTNQDIADLMTDLGVQKNSDEIIADSDEPKSIEEIRLLDFNIRGVKKGPGSVEFGHQKVRQYKQYWTEDSLNCIKEQRNFKYMADKSGKLTEKTTHNFSHGMDSRRYPVMYLSEEPEPESSIVVYDAMQNMENMDLAL